MGLSFDENEKVSSTKGNNYYDNIPFPFTLFPFLYPIIWPEPLKTGFVRTRDAIDVVKAANLVVPLAIVAYYNAWDNHTACLYVTMSGMYGMWWLVKSTLFPDRRWEGYCPLWYFFLVQAVYWTYYTIPWYICAYDVQLPAWRLAGTVMVWSCGVLLIFVSDMQKTIQLELAPGQMIDTKMFTYVRNPNYLGELFNYCAFVSLAGHWWPFVYHIPVAILVVVPGLFLKEKSLRRYPKFKQWEKRSWVYIPFVW